MKKIEEMSLEDAMKALQETVAEIEENELSLDKSITLFEQGLKLVAHSRRLLDEYNSRITVLKKENGVLKEVVWDNDDDA